MPRDMSKACAAAALAKHKFKNAEQLQQMVDEYFDECKQNNRIPTEHALANKLGVTRETLYRWVTGSLDTEFIKPMLPILKEAYDRIADEYVQLLNTGEKNMTSFVIFALKQLAFGAYKDRIENHNETTVKVQFGDGIETSDFK